MPRHFSDISTVLKYNHKPEIESKLSKNDVDSENRPRLILSTTTLLESSQQYV